MKFEVRTSRRAQRDIREAVAWYRERSGSAEVAGEWVDGVQSAIHSLAENPDRCHLAHETERFDQDVRELLYGSGRRKTHRVLFQVEGSVVNVIAVRHFAQRDFTPDDM